MAIKINNWLLICYMIFLFVSLDAQRNHWENKPVKKIMGRACEALPIIKEEKK
jgi:hypothetical protein